MLLHVLLRHEQSLNHTKIQEIKGHLNSWLTLSSECCSESWSECSSRVQKVVLTQAQKLKYIIKNMQVTCDMNKCPVKYICMDQSRNKGIYKINV